MPGEGGDRSRSLQYRPPVSKNPLEIVARLSALLSTAQEIHALGTQHPTYIDAAVTNAAMDEITIKGGTLKNRLSVPATQARLAEKEGAAMADLIDDIDKAIAKLLQDNDGQMKYLREFSHYRGEVKDRGAAAHYSPPEGDDGERQQAILACNAKVSALNKLWGTGVEGPGFHLKASLSSMAADILR